MILANGLSPLPSHLRRWQYNALDADITHEVAEALLPRVEGDPYYGFSMTQQAPAFAMMIRGIRVDEEARRAEEQAHAAIEAAAAARLTDLAPLEARPLTSTPQRCTTKNGAHRWKGGEASVDGSPSPYEACVRCHTPRWIQGEINPRSPPQISRLFYDVLGLPERHNHKTHQPSVDDECLEALARATPSAAPLAAAILEARRARKQAALMRAPLDADGRWRSSFNVGAAVTGRWSSSESPQGRGGNIQNIAKRSRGIFVADPGFLMFEADYKSAESSITAWDAEDEAYIRAIETGDIYTAVARLVWPLVREWTGDLIQDRALAEQPAPWDANHALRWYSKHVALGTAIGMTEYGIARDARIKLKEARAARTAFMARFPRIAVRQDEIWCTVQETRTLVSPLGRRRVFHGRLYGSGAPATRREALAQTQQSMIVDWVSVALCRIWNELDGGAGTPRLSDPNRIWLLAQVHDAILGLVRLGDDVTLARVRALMEMPLSIHGRELVIPVEIKVGPNWGEMEEWDGARH